MGWERFAYTGQKVVCISDDMPRNPWHQRHMPKVGEVYSIQEILPIRRQCGKETVGVRIDDSPRAWDAARFRPVTPKSTETGMKMIRSILDRAPVKEDA